MKGAIFERLEINIWKNMRDEEKNYPAMKPEEARINDYNFILSTLKSYRPSPNGNGIKWSKEEKEAFIKLSYKEQRKMIVRK
ncbi:hypothetical protein CQA53_10475, partial [Helicobacter didelphidarum]